MLSWRKRSRATARIRRSCNEGLGQTRFQFIHSIQILVHPEQCLDGSLPVSAGSGKTSPPNSATTSSPPPARPPVPPEPDRLTHGVGVPLSTGNFAILVFLSISGLHDLRRNR